MNCSMRMEHPQRRNDLHPHLWPVTGPQFAVLIRPVCSYCYLPSSTLFGVSRVLAGSSRVLAGSGGFTAGLCRVIWFWVLLALYSEGGGGFMNFFNQFNQFELTELVQICGLPVGLVVGAPKVVQI